MVERRGNRQEIAIGEGGISKNLHTFFVVGESVAKYAQYGTVDTTASAQEHTFG